MKACAFLYLGPVRFGFIRRHGVRFHVHGWRDDFWSGWHWGLTVV